MGKTITEKPKLVLTEMAEEAHQKEQAMRITKEELLQDIMELETF